MHDDVGPSHHILLYGPPAAGKLTVARALADGYGPRVLDNHLSVDPALRLFAFGTPGFGALVERLRVTMLVAAARAGIDVVTTLVYAHLLDDAHLAALTAASVDHGGVVTLVQLCPSPDALAERIVAPSRIGTQKITDPDQLRRMMFEFDLCTPASADGLVIDNTDLTPADVAALIADHVGLSPCPTS